MAATVIINRYTGDTPDLTPITGIKTRANAYDEHSTADEDHPIWIPGNPDLHYSYWVVTRLQCTVAPPSLIDNLRWYTDGVNGFGTGIVMWVGRATNYEQATGSGVSGDELSHDVYGSLVAITVGQYLENAFVYTVDDPLSLDGSTSTTGHFGDYVVYQLEISSTAAAGNTGVETVIWSRDEG